MRWHASAGTCCIRKNAAGAVRDAGAGEPWRRAGDRVDRLHEAFRRPDPRHIPAPYKVLGTDGFGRSDYRRKLRAFFEVDRHFVAVAALKSLADSQLLPARTVSEAIKKYGIDPNKADPTRS